MILYIYISIFYTIHDLDTCETDITWVSRRSFLEYVLICSMPANLLAPVAHSVWMNDNWDLEIHDNHQQGPMIWSKTLACPASARRRELTWCCFDWVARLPPWRNFAHVERRQKRSFGNHLLDCLVFSTLHFACESNCWLLYWWKNCFLLLSF